MVSGGGLPGPADLADAVAAGLRGRAERDDLEQVVYGFDALDELGLHPLLAEAIEAAGHGVLREQRYPGHWRKRKKSEGQRCDLVVTPDGLPLRDPAMKATLFDRQPAVDAEEAYWLEVKTVAQFELDGAFRGYSSELLTPVMADLKKVWLDGVIAHGGLLVVLFTASAEIAEHDLAAFHRRALEKGMPVYPPCTRGFGITDRIGNARCTVSVFGVR
ncbi:MAG: hypothetical protein AAF078_14545 [Planctomycetota bacterium]